MNTTTKYCDLARFQKNYEELHGPLSIIVCVLGSIANILNICVLSRKEMRCSTNLILTGLAVADLLVMIEYIPFSYHGYFDLEKRKYANYFTYNWAIFMIFHATFSLLFHFVSCCLTVILALWRYLTIKNPPITKFWCDLRKTLLVIIFTYLLCPLICFPLYLSYQVLPLNRTTDVNEKLINVESNETKIHYSTIYVVQYVNEFYSILVFWLYTVIIKLVPCVLLTVLSTKLVLVLLETKKRKNRLLQNRLPLNNLQSDSKPMINHKVKKDKQADRTSGMLVAVLLLFLITEFPQAILGLLSATLKSSFHSQCYIPLGDLLDILALTNSGINFILYCTMSRQFRQTFYEFFKLKYLMKFNPLPEHHGHEKTGEKVTQITAHV
ncbi:G-protein coupled receptor dmsr-1-like [Diorhabda carinulata]|uniref:G-protein coupled receptor dmsr-1-like n=1 Tax=Diorhabda carinulata TaxID=1163345 RepID=UPI0025A0C20C|nr:G-protein coupled receptor dmsr-1-like [Diorhabda carinulata]